MELTDYQLKREEHFQKSLDELQTKIEEHFRERIKNVDIPTVTHYDNGLTSLVGKGYSLTMNTNNFQEMVNKIALESLNK